MYVQRLHINEERGSTLIQYYLILDFMQFVNYVRVKERITLLFQHDFIWDVM